MSDSKREKELLDNIRSDPDKFSQVYEQYYSPIFNYVLKRVVGFEQARDISSEVFIKAFLNIQRYQWRGISLKYWLYRIATNEVNLFHRAKKYKPEFLQAHFSDKAFDFLQTDLEQEKHLAEKEIQQYEQFLVVQDIIKGLPVHYQEVLSLRYYEKMSIREICLVLSKKEGTIKSLLSRGLEKIRGQL